MSIKGLLHIVSGDNCWETAGATINKASTGCSEALSMVSLRTALFQDPRHQPAKSQWCKEKLGFCLCQILVRRTPLQNKSPFPFSHEARALLNYRNWIPPPFGTWLVVLHFWAVPLDGMCMSVGNLNEYFRESRWHKKYTNHVTAQSHQNETFHTKCKGQTSMKTMKARITHRDAALSILATPAHEKFSDSGAGHFLRPDFSIDFSLYRLDQSSHTLCLRDVFPGPVLLVLIYWRGGWEVFIHLASPL